MTRSCSAFAYLTLFSLFGLSQGFLTAPANAQVTPVEGWSKVNDGTAGCTSGVCKISGGVSSGKNLFHKLEKLNTKNGTIEKVSIDNIDQTSIILANIGSDLSEISVPFEALGSKADIAILSPSGINLSDGFSTNNINKLTLSTSDQIEVGAGLFDVNDTTFEQAQNLTESINYATLTNGIPNGSLIKLSDNLSIDSDLLIVSENISIDQATVQSSNDLEINGRLYVNDSSVAADSLSVVANGLFNQLEAIYVGNSSTIEINGDISIDGTGKSESSSDDLTSGSSNGVQIADSTIRSISGNIKIKGLAGKGNYINGYEFAPSGTSYDFIDIVGDGVDMYNTSVNAINGTIEIDGTGAEGSRSMGTGIDILSSKIQAQELALNGVGAKGIEVIRDPLGVRIRNNSDIHTVGPLTITGSAGNTVKNTTTDVNSARGIEVHSSDLKSDRGMITLSGTGGSGNQVKHSHGILLWHNSSIRGPRIKLMGIGGKATDVSAPNAPSLEMYNYYDQQYGNSYFNSGIFISDNTKIVSNPVNDDYGSTIILGDSSNNNGDIELVGYGGNGVDYIGGVVVADNPSLIDSGGDLTISGTSGTENDFVLDSQGVSLRGQGGGGGPTNKAVGKITIHGRGGSGETINDGVGIHIHSVNITAKDLEIKGYGGRAEKIATLTWGTGLFESTINLDGTLDIYGEGGYAKTSRTDSIASMNGGVIIFGNTLN